VEAGTPSGRRPLSRRPLDVEAGRSVSRQCCAARAAVSGELSDAEWERVRPLLPPQKPTTGRPRHDHRTVLNGILSVTRTDASWREIPTECGKWETAYKRYRLWCDTGLWQHILIALADQAHEVSL